MVSKVSYYSASSQELKVDGRSHSRYWSIRSEKMSFTYFEVPPNTTFEKHRHASEQITYVLNGELFFEVENECYCLKQGDSIVIPSNIEHRVWTSSAGCIAVDSWTPANEKY